MKKNFIRITALALILLFCFPLQWVKAYQMDRFAAERQIFRFLTEDMGFGKAAACGVLANIEAESDFSPLAVGDSGTSFGICQWHESRCVALMAYCGAAGLDYRTLTGQLEYLKYELHSNYQELFGQLRTLDDTPESAYMAGFLWCVKFERPLGMEISGAARGKTAQYKYWNRYQNYRVEKPEAPDSVPDDMPGELEEPVNPQEFLTLVEHFEERLEHSRTPATQKPGKVIIKSYQPRHKPIPPQGSNPALGIALGLGFVILGDGISHKPAKLRTPEEAHAPIPA